LNVIEAKDLFGSDVSTFGNPVFNGDYITVPENNDFAIFDRNFELVK
jgi:hypothetical protein